MISYAAVRHERGQSTDYASERAQVVVLRLLALRSLWEENSDYNSVICCPLPRRLRRVLQMQINTTVTMAPHTMPSMIGTRSDVELYESLLLGSLSSSSHSCMTP